MVSGVALFLLLFSSFSFADVGDPNEGLPVNEILRAIPRNAVHPSCIDNYEDWPHSDRLKADAPWNLQFIPYEDFTQLRKYRRELFIDINDDGLQDYVYAMKTVDGANVAEECVALNAGSGTWNVVFRCRSFNNTFYGDCADTD